MYTLPSGFTPSLPLPNSTRTHWARPAPIIWKPLLSSPFPSIFYLSLAIPFALRTANRTKMLSPGAYTYTVGRFFFVRISHTVPKNPNKQCVSNRCLGVYPDATSGQSQRLRSPTVADMHQANHLMNTGRKSTKAITYFVGFDYTRNRLGSSLNFRGDVVDVARYRTVLLNSHDNTLPQGLTPLTLRTWPHSRAIRSLDPIHIGESELKSSPFASTPRIYKNVVGSSGTTAERDSRIARDVASKLVGPIPVTKFIRRYPRLPETPPRTSRVFFL